MLQADCGHDPVSKLVYELSRLPGIGEKTATRLAYHILRQDEYYSRDLAAAITGAKMKTGLCKTCFTFTDSDQCRICADTSRERTKICIVEKPSDVFSIENAGVHRGLYHVLHGALSPLDGIGPEELKIRELLARIPVGNCEIIIAVNPSVEGDATAFYLARLIKPLGAKVTRLAHGIPVGGMIEYSDKQTLGRAMENRVEMTG
ncbi:MAG: recombination protein RecR [Bdellovibrionales bacterium RIFOXYD1_FULL_53_11]|nr:MAG: recombination protein RecR [Bdellovibrionales bacterium RIFOXYD1_FULL_53_11]